MNKFFAAAISAGLLTAGFPFSSSAETAMENQHIGTLSTLEDLKLAAQKPTSPVTISVNPFPTTRFKIELFVDQNPLAIFSTVFSASKIVRPPSTVKTKLRFLESSMQPDAYDYDVIKGSSNEYIPSERAELNLQITETGNRYNLKNSMGFTNSKTKAPQGMGFAFLQAANLAVQMDMGTVPVQENNIQSAWNFKRQYTGTINFLMDNSFNDSSVGSSKVAGLVWCKRDNPQPCALVEVNENSQFLQGDHGVRMQINGFALINTHSGTIDRLRLNIIRNLDRPGRTEEKLYLFKISKLD